jgi:hypothetical protein
MQARVIPATALAIDSFRESLRSLLVLEPDQLTRLRELTETDTGFEPTDELIRRLREVLGITERDSASILSVCHYLYDCAQEGQNAEALVRELGEVSGELKIGGFPAKQDHLKRLFSPNEAYDRRAMARQIGEAALPVLERTWLYCDLRAVGARSTTEAPRYVPVIVARLRFDEPIAGQEAISFQMSEEALGNLALDVERIRELMGKIRLDLKDKLY